MNYCPYAYGYCCPPPVCPPVPCPPPQCPTVSYITNVATTTSVPSGGSLIPLGSTIADGNTTVPLGTVTVINGYTTAPTTNIGGITANNGFFTVNIGGRYAVSADVCFDTVASTLTTDIRQAVIYKVEKGTALVTLQAVDSRLPIAGSPTCINLGTTIELASGDRVFVAARQTNGLAAIVGTVPGIGRLTITRIC